MYWPYLDIDVSDFKNRIYMAELLVKNGAVYVKDHMKMQIRFMTLQMPPKSRYSKVRDVLHREKLLPSSSKYKYSSLLETLALIGILDTESSVGINEGYLQKLFGWMDCSSVSLTECPDQMQV